MTIPIEISARHVHLSEADFKKLFGKNVELKPIHSLSQTGEFASDKTIEIINGKEKLNARVLGPLRKESQAEISITDAHKLKLKKIPKIKVSGDLNHADTITIQNQKNKAKIKIIVAKRHLHLNPETANKLKLKNNQKIKIKTFGERALIFDEIVVRINPSFTTALHLDTDEGNSAGIKGKNNFGEILR